MYTCIKFTKFSNSTIITKINKVNSKLTWVTIYNPIVSGFVEAIFKTLQEIKILEIKLFFDDTIFLLSKVFLCYF